MTEEQIAPFAIIIHGDSSGRMASFYYGITLEHVIKNLETILSDYKKTAEEAEKETLQYNETGKASISDSPRNRVYRKTGKRNLIQR